MYQITKRHNVIEYLCLTALTGIAFFPALQCFPHAYNRIFVDAYQSSWWMALSSPFLWQFYIENFVIPLFIAACYPRLPSGFLTGLAAALLLLWWSSAIIQAILYINALWLLPGAQVGMALAVFLTRRRGLSGNQSRLAAFLLPLCCTPWWLLLDEVLFRQTPLRAATAVYYLLWLTPVAILLGLAVKKNNTVTQSLQSSGRDVALFAIIAGIAVITVWLSAWYVRLNISPHAAMFGFLPNRRAVTFFYFILQCCLPWLVMMFLPVGSARRTAVLLSSVVVFLYWWFEFAAYPVWDGPVGMFATVAYFIFFTAVVVWFVTWLWQLLRSLKHGEPRNQKGVFLSACLLPLAAAIAAIMCFVALVRIAIILV